MVLGIVIALAWGLIRRPKDFPLSRLEICILAGILSYAGLFGAKILYIILHPGRSITAAGYAFLGAFVLEITALYVYSKARKVSFFDIGDYVLPFCLFAQAFTRVGCFFAPCCYGRTTKVPWGVVFASVSPDLRHPTQLYSMFALIIIFVLMRFLYSKRHRSGTIMFSSIALYGTIRLGIETLRVDSVAIIGNVTLAEIACFTIAMFGFTALAIILRRRTK